MEREIRHYPRMEVNGKTKKQRDHIFHITYSFRKKKNYTSTIIVKKLHCF